MTFDPLTIPHVFHARSVRRSKCVLPTGFHELDEALLGGWPTPSLIEILIDLYGIGELQLLIPLLRRLIQTGPKPPIVVWLNAPYVPNGVALAQHHLHAGHWIASNLGERDVLWAAEQSLRSNACSVGLAWTSTSNTAALRRLKLAAMSTDSVGILFRPIQDAARPSPANLRMVLRPIGDRLSLEVIKNEGRHPCLLAIDVRSGPRASSIT
jgi:protein ImuA